MTQQPLITVKTDLHGRLHLNIGERMYIYSNPLELALGIAYHTHISPEGADRKQIIEVLRNNEEMGKVIKRAVTAVKHELEGANARCKRYVEKNAELRATIRQYQKEYGKL